MFEKLIEILKANPRKIVFPEGTDARILEAAARLKKDGFLTPVLIGNVDEVKAAAAKGGFDIEGLEIIDPATYPDMDKFVDDFVALRKGKATAEDARAMLQKSNYFGTMLVKEGLADSLLGGATYSTADTVRPALQLVKTKKGSNLVSSCFILARGDEMIAMGDCAINISYEDKKDKDGNVVLTAAQQVAEVAVETARTAKVFGIAPPRSSASTRRSPCSPSPPRAPARAPAPSSCATPPPSSRRPIRSSPATVRCSLTPPSPPLSASSNSPAALSPAMPTPSSSRRSSPATSATRSPSASAATWPSVLSCRA